MEYLSDTVREEKELKNLVDVPVLGIVPEFKNIDHENDNYYSNR